MEVANQAEKGEIDVTIGDFLAFTWATRYTAMDAYEFSFIDSVD